MRKLFFHIKRIIFEWLWGKDFIDSISIDYENQTVKKYDKKLLTK